MFFMIKTMKTEWIYNIYYIGKLRARSTEDLNCFFKVT